MPTAKQMIISLVSLPRKLSELRFASAFAILLSVYLVLVIVIEALSLLFRKSDADENSNATKETGNQNKGVSEILDSVSDSFESTAQSMV